MGRLILLFLTFAAVSCSQVVPFETLHVDANSTETERLQNLQKVYSVESSQTDNIAFAKSKVVWKEQLFRGTPVKDAWIKMLESNSKSKSLEEFGAQVILGPSSKIDFTFPKIWDEKSLLAQAQKQLPKYKLDSIKPYWKNGKKQMIPVYEVVALDKKNHLFAIDLDARSFKVLEKTPVGSHFTPPTGSDFIDLKAFVFPDGPRRSPLTEVELSEVHKGSPLSSQKLHVTSASGENITISDDPLHFDVEDSKFNQVQAFFILQKANLWFEENLGWSWAGKLQVETDIGYPDKTNAMFSYQNKVRLGRGDGITYKDIPQDPSIVVHESVHAIVARLAGLPFQGEGGSLNEAYCDFFTAMHLDRSIFGDAAYMKGQYKRDISQPRMWNSIRGSLYGDSMVISSFLWELSTQIEKKKAMNLAIHTLRKLYPDETFQRFQSKLKASAKELLTGEDLRKFEGLLKQRGWVE